MMIFPDNGEYAVSGGVTVAFLVILQYLDLLACLPHAGPENCRISPTRFLAG